MQSKNLSIILVTVLGLGSIGFVGCGSSSSTPADSVVPIVEYNSTVPRTGQTISYAQYDDGWYVTNRGLGVERRFTDDTAASDSIMDDVTNLRWRDGLGPIMNVVNPGDFTDAESFCESGWRLPTILELVSITDKSKSNSAIFSPFTNIGATFDYWSIDVFSDGSGNQWIVSFDTGGDTTKGTAATDIAYVRCVQGAGFAPPAGRFDTSVDEVVVDTWSNLMWQDNKISTAADWGDAIDQCEALELAGKTDWRLPNFNELYSLADRLSGANPAIDTSFDFTEVEGIYWTSTTFIEDTDVAWTVDFTDGRDLRTTKSITNRPFRCVRTR